MNGVDNILEDIALEIIFSMKNIWGVVMELRFMISYLIKAIEFEWNLHLDPETIVFKLERWS